jgi:hypothetical protein
MPERQQNRACEAAQQNRAIKNGCGFFSVHGNI